jgi:peptidase E
VTGPFALVGGTEHHPGCETTDRWLLVASGASRPVVTVVPFASSVRTRARTVGVAIDWWQRLGAVPLVAGPTVDQAVAAIDNADVLVLPGGVPDRLHGRLVGTPVWDRLLARWRAGTPLSGSSSGAMVLGEVRQSFRVTPGFGALQGIAVAPHHQRTVPRWVAASRARTHPHLTIVGVDDRTALVGTRSGELRVMGSGEVTLRRGVWWRTYPSGAVLAPEELGWLPAPAARRIAAAGDATADAAAGAAPIGVPVGRAERSPQVA